MRVRVGRCIHTAKYHTYKRYSECILLHDSLDSWFPPRTVRACLRMYTWEYINKANNYYYEKTYIVYMCVWLMHTFWQISYMYTFIFTWLVDSVISSKEYACVRMYTREYIKKETITTTRTHCEFACVCGCLHIFWPTPNVYIYTCISLHDSLNSWYPTRMYVCARGRMQTWNILIKGTILT